MKTRRLSLWSSVGPVTPSARPVGGKSRWRWLTRLCITAGAAALSLIAAPNEVAAHNLQTRMVYMFLDKDTQAMLDNRIANGWVPGTPILQAGDEVGLITKVIPDSAGTNTGVGGHVDFYVPNGVTVIDVGYMIPDGNGGFVKAAMKGQSPIATGAGPIGTKATAELSSLATVNYTSPNGITTTPVGAGGVHRGTIAGVYGDTGIFFSTDPSTAWSSWQTFTGHTDLDDIESCGLLTLYPNLTPGVDGETITNNSGDVFIPCNKWDAEQLFAWGAKGTSYAGAKLRSGVAIVDYPDQRGNAPWGFASATAGPQSGYAWEFDWDAYITATGAGGYTGTAALAGMTPSKIGPWQRIQYNGSRISFDNPGSPLTTLGYASKDASTLGTPVSPATPLPSTTSQTDPNGGVKTIRWAVGQLTQNRPEYVWVKVRVDSPQADFLDSDGCPHFHGDTFGGDAGGTDNGKDHLWRYYEPTVFSWNGCYAAGKTSTREFANVGSTFQYTVKAYNLGTQPQTNVTITDVLPSGLAFVSAAPAQNSGPNPLRWNVGTLQPGQKFESVVTVRVTGTGQLENCISIDSNEQPAQKTCDITVTTPAPYLIQTKDASPTTIAPGQPVTYTLTVSNIGSGPTASPVTITDFLPTGFTYASLVSATANGAAVTPTVNAANTSQPVFTVPFALQNGKDLVITFIANTSANLAGGSYCNTYSATQNGVPLRP